MAFLAFKIIFTLWQISFAANSLCNPLFGQLGEEALVGLHPQLQDLESKVWAVHVRATAPGDSLETRIAGQPLQGYVINRRPTIHFSLGEMVQPHSKNSWDDNKFAVLTQLGSLKEQMINLNAYDTFILGAYKLSKRDTLLAPISEKSKVASAANVVFYDDSKSTLRMAVDEFISSQSGWAFRMEKTAAKEGKAIFRGENVNTVKFFEPFLRAHPHISFGDHLSSVKGDFWRIGLIEQSLHEITRGFGPYGNPSHKNMLEKFSGFLQHNLKKMDERIGAGDVPPQIRIEYERFRDEAKTWVLLGEIEKDAISGNLHRRNPKFPTGNFSIQTSSKEVKNELIDLRQNPEKLEEKLASLIQAGKITKLDPHKEFGLDMSGYYSDFLRWLPRNEQEALRGQR